MLMLLYWTQHDGLEVCGIVPARRPQLLRQVAFQEDGLYSGSDLALVEELKSFRFSH